MAKAVPLIVAYCQEPRAAIIFLRLSPTVSVYTNHLQNIIPNLLFPFLQQQIPRQDENH